jgi:hypothetical protein
MDISQPNQMIRSLQPTFEVGLHTLIVTVIALLLGTFMEKVFARKQPFLGLLQVFFNGIAYDLVREYYKPEPDAWVFFSVALLYAQPSLLPRLRYMLRI